MLTVMLACIAALAMPVSAAGAQTQARARAVHASSSVVERVQALVQHDPKAALRLGEPYWKSGPPAKQQFALGLLLMQAASALHEQRKVVAIGERLDRESLDPLQRARMLFYLIANISVTGDAGRINGLRKQLERVDGELTDHRELVARLWRILAAAYYHNGQVNQAQKVARIAISKVPRHPDRVDVGANQIIAIGYIRQGKIPDAIKSMMKADEAGRALGMPDRPQLLLNFTGLFVYTKNWTKVIEYGKRTLAAKPNMRTREIILGDIAAAHAEMGDVGKAAVTYRKALDLARAHHFPTGTLLNNFGDMLQKHHRPRQALALFRKAIAAFEQPGDTDKSGLATAYSNLGATWVDLGQRQKAAKAFQRSLALFKHSDDVDVRLELYPRMIDNLEALGHDRQALDLMREFKATNDKHVTVASKTEVAKLQSVIEVERQKRQLAEAARQRAAQKSALDELQVRDQRQRVMVYGMLVALVLLGLVALIKIRESRMRRRLNRQLEHKNAEVRAQHQDLTKLNEVIRRQSEEDALTGLYNRRYGQAWIERLAARQLEEQKQGAHLAPVLLMLLDIDRFKRINDTHGHETGDRALMYFTEVLRECSRKSDVLVRWGGEEFLWICPDTSLSEAPVLFARLRASFASQPFALADGTMQMNASLGYCTMPVDANAVGDCALCLRVADAALYRAKRLGRNRAVGFKAGAAGITGSPHDVADMEAQGMLVLIQKETENVDPG